MRLEKHIVWGCVIGGCVGLIIGAINSVRSNSVKEEPKQCVYLASDPARYICLNNGAGGTNSFKDPVTYACFYTFNEALEAVRRLDARVCFK